MLSLASGPFLFDTSAESWLTRSHDPAVRGWFREYLSLYPVHISALTVVERLRGYTRRAECISSRNRGRSAWFAGASTA